MYSTNARISISSFNPKPNDRGYNFAILGENIALHPDDDQSPLLSGTSYAAAIGAGLAAQLLDFVRQEDARGIISKPDDLRRSDCMSAVFAKDGKERGYDCMMPWTLLETVDEDRHGRAEKSRLVCDTISRTPKGKYR
ncbi:hypothetical protein QBC35DRAFT_392426 [Podospora australis]|uniref:Peptidase S8/S53 domain-containing protein n=1 Tax=Podospora australis TaxID=1536484 RepID=A0AAN6WLK0_9PEZI|nr:hypothetical protein QBC35DRAFT_392426 [Podospora australis]